MTLQVNVSLFYLAGFDAKRQIRGTEAEDGRQQQDETDDARRYHPVFSPWQIRHCISDQGDPHHCADDTINPTNVFCHYSYSFPVWTFFVPGARPGTSLAHFLRAPASNVPINRPLVSRSAARSAAPRC